MTLEELFFLDMKIFSTRKCQIPMTNKIQETMRCDFEMLRKGKASPLYLKIIKELVRAQTLNHGVKGGKCLLVFVEGILADQDHG